MRLVEKLRPALLDLNQQVVENPGEVVDLVHVQMNLPLDPELEERASRAGTYSTALGERGGCVRFLSGFRFFHDRLHLPLYRAPLLGDSVPTRVSRNLSTGKRESEVVRPMSLMPSDQRQLCLNFF